MSEHLKPLYRDAIEAAGLTSRQKYVLDHWLDHHSIRRIALALDLSESTVRGHLDAAIRKIRPFVRKDDQNRRAA